MKKLSGKINLKQEFEALVEFVELNWNTKTELRDLLCKVWSKGLELYADTTESENRVTNKIINFYESKNDYINSSLKKATEVEKSIIIGSHPYVIFSRILLRLTFSNVLKIPVDLNYYDLESILKEFLKDYPVCNEIKPKGWKELEKNYTDYDGMEDYEEKIDKDIFNGTDVEPNARSFVLKISLPQVMYDEICQGNKAIIILMMSVLDHARKCVSHNNAIDFLSEIEKVEDYFLKLKDIFPMPFSLSLENVTNNKILVQAFEKAKDKFITKEGLKKEIINKEHYLSLPEEKKIQIKADIAKHIQDILLKNKLNE